MISLPCCFVLFVSCVYVGLSAPLEPTFSQKLNQAMLEMTDESYQAYLLFSIPAASAGKNLFRMPHSLSDSCVRTARAILHFWTKPSTSQQAFDVIVRSHSKAVADKSNGLFQKQVNTTCRNINAGVKKRPADFPNFEEVTRDVEVPKPKVNYIYEAPTNRNIHDWLNEEPMNLDDPEMFEFKTVIQFRVLMKSAVSAENSLDNVSTARAIERLSASPNFRSTVDTVFVRALHDYMKDSFAQNVDKFEAARSTAFVKKLDQYFLKNFILKEEYKEIKKRVVDEIQDASSNE